jgi:hypothetical protein
VEVSKVKKSAGVTGERNVKGKKTAKASRAAANGAKGNSKAPSKRARNGGKATVQSPARRSAAPMRKASAASQRSGKGARNAPVASRVKGKRVKLDRSKKGKPSLARGRRVVSDAPVVTVAVKALDPLRKCGPNTTVQFLYRVDESVGGQRTAHLVFFDRHGWYCEHGRTCPAVGHAKKHNGQIARVS